MTAEPSHIRLVRAGDRRQHDVGRRYGEIGPVMLADAESIDADGIGEHAFFDHVADDLGVRFEAAVGVSGDVAERIQAEFDMLSHVSVTSLP